MSPTPSPPTSPRSSQPQSSGSDEDEMPSLSLPEIITSNLLKSIRTQPNLPRQTWPIIASVTLSCINRPDEIPRVFNAAVEDGGEIKGDKGGENGGKVMGEKEQLFMIRRVREGLVKSAAVVGLPKTINALLALKTSTPPSLVDLPMSPSPSLRPIDVHDTPVSQILHRGQKFFDKVYGKISQRVMGQMDRCGTEDLGTVARLMYAYLLSNERVLDGRESSFVLVAGLVPQDVNPQLKGHLKGAINNGATIEEVRAVRDVVIRICEAGGMRRIGKDEPGGWGWRSEVANL